MGAHDQRLGWGLNVNLWGMIHGVKAFVPAMLAVGEPGHVVNTSSGNGRPRRCRPPLCTPPPRRRSPCSPRCSTGSCTRSTPTSGCRCCTRAPTCCGPACSSRQRTVHRRGPTTRPAPPHTPRSSPSEARMKAAGVDVNYTPVEFVAEATLEAIRANRFWILPESERIDGRTFEPGRCSTGPNPPTWKADMAAPLPTDPYLVISADCHAGLPNEEYREWLDPEFREPFDEAASRPGPATGDGRPGLSQHRVRRGVERRELRGAAGRLGRRAARRRVVRRRGGGRGDLPRRRLGHLRRLGTLRRAGPTPTPRPICCWPGPRPTTAGWPSCAPPAPSAGPGWRWCRLSPGWRSRSPRSGGPTPGTVGRHPHPADVAATPALSPHDVRPDLGGM